MHVQHRIQTGGPSNGNTNVSTVSDSGTRFKFSAAVRSSFVSVLPHSGHVPENNLSFRGRLGFIFDPGRRLDDPCKRRSKSAAGGGPIVRHPAQLTAVTLRGQAATEKCGWLSQWRSFPAGTSGPTKRSTAPSIFVGGPAAATDFEPPVRVAAGRHAQRTGHAHENRRARRVAVALGRGCGGRASVFPAPAVGA